MTQQIQWLIAARRSVAGETVECPRCGAEAIDYQYVADEDTRLGYMDVWCNECNHGTHVSRVEVPKGVEMLSMNEEESVLSGRIPEYIPVEVEADA